jgi:hypothetical protein
MNVVDMREFRSRETVAVLAHLLDRARKGEVDGVSVCTRFGGGREEIAFTGCYRRTPALSIASIIRVFQRLARLLEDDQEDRETGG